MSTSFFLTLRPDATVSGSRGEFVVQTAASRLAFRQPGAALLGALHDLAGEGADERILHDRVLREAGAEALARLACYQQRLDRRGLLLRSVRAGGTPLLTLVPTSPHFEFTPGAVRPDRGYILCRFGHARRDGAGTVLESPLAHARVRLHGPRGVAVLHALAEPGTPAELTGRSSDLSPAALELLVGARMVREAGDEPAELSAWGFHDLLFHASTRSGRHDRPTGGTFPPAGGLAPPPALATVNPSAWVDLYRPDLERLLREDPPLARLDDLRRVRTPPGAAPIDLRQLGEFLFRAARVRYVCEVRVRTPHGPVPVDFALRPYPGGGALYELELYPVVQGCTGLDPGLYHYDPLHHRLGLLRGRTPDVRRLVADAARSAAVPVAGLPVLLVVTARHQRRAWKYPSTAYSTTLKNLGVLHQTMDLVASAMGLAVCSLPGGDSGLFASAAGRNPHVESSVGEFLLGTGSDRGG
jgi:SagB-type dehydrogenase family enzyme